MHMYLNFALYVNKLYKFYEFKLAAQQPFNFSYLPKFLIFSSVQGAVHFPLLSMRKTLKLKIFCYKSFGTGVVNNQRNVYRHYLSSFAISV